MRDLFSFRVRDQGEFKEKIEEEVKRYLKELIRQKIEKILMDPAVGEIEVCIRDFGINLEPDIFDYLEDILKEHGFREVGWGSNDCFIFRKR
jgi:hypothetical protein